MLCPGAIPWPVYSNRNAITDEKDKLTSRRAADHDTPFCIASGQFNRTAELLQKRCLNSVS